MGAGVGYPPPPFLYCLPPPRSFFRHFSPFFFLFPPFFFLSIDGFINSPRCALREIIPPTVCTTRNTRCIGHRTFSFFFTPALTVPTPTPFSPLSLSLCLFYARDIIMMVKLKTCIAQIIRRFAFRVMRGEGEVDCRVTFVSGRTHGKRERERERNREGCRRKDAARGCRGRPSSRPTWRPVTVPTRSNCFVLYVILNIHELNI